MPIDFPLFEGELTQGPNGQVTRVTWRPADKPFFAVLVFDKLEKGRVVFRSRGLPVIMFPTELTEMIRKGHFLRQSNEGYWAVVKRRNSYGVRFLGVGPPHSKGE